MVCGDGYLSPYSTPRRPEYLVVCKLAGLSSLGRCDGKNHISLFPLLRVFLPLPRTKKGHPAPLQGKIPLENGKKRRFLASFCVALFVVKRSYATATGSLLRLRLRFGFASASVWASGSIASSSASIGSASGSTSAVASFCAASALLVIIGITTT